MDTNKHTHIIYIIIATLVLAAVLGVSFAFGQTFSSTNQYAEDIALINAKINEIQQTYSNLKTSELRAKAKSVLEAYTSFCQKAGINCSSEIELLGVGIRGAAKSALAQIVQDGWKSINKKIKQAPKLVEYAGSQVPEKLVEYYKDTAFQETVNSTAESLGKMVATGNISNTLLESVLRNVFDTAAADTAVFTNSLMEKYNLQNIAMAALNNPKNAKAVGKAVEREIKNYAEQEINKLANQALGTMLPVLQGVQIDFTELNSKNLKSTLRSAIVNALAQSYLGPQYVAVYMAVSTVCPTCMEKMHAELRRFDKKYIQPGTEKIEDEWSRFEDRVKAESERVAKQIEAEWQRLNARIAAELNRQIKQVAAEADRANQRFLDELKRAQESRVGQEIERQLNDISDEAKRGIGKAEDELEREFNDVISEAGRLGRRVEAELNRQIETAESTFKKLTEKAENELKREVKSVVNEAQKAKEKVEAELQRAADRVKAEAERAKNKVKAEVKRWKKKLRF